MNKTAIKNFSIWARNKLIDGIRYRAGLLGITEDDIQSPLPQSTKGTEFYDIGTAEPYSISTEAVRQRRKLVEAIREKERKSDYQTAYKYTVEEVAYTWFNRLIAIRFMEVNDYLPSHIRVLSSDSGKLEPDLVTTPFDAELPFTADEEQTVMQLKRDNQIDELFRMLFIKQCNALNEILPGLFEKTNDYTELLLSVSVVDQTGVVYRLTHDINEDEFNIEKGGQVEIIGWLYQYWNTEPKDAVFSRPSGAKIKKEEIPAATQLFTPDWIVRYMVENSLGRIFVDWRKNAGIWGDGRGYDEYSGYEEYEQHRISKEKKIAEDMGWKYYLPEAVQEKPVREEIDKTYRDILPEELKLIDPCMGSGHILIYAFDVFMQIYTHFGWTERDAAQSILRHNLYGLDIDKRATQLAYFSVMMKARQYDRRFLSRGIQPMVYCTTGDEDGENFGSLVMVDDPGEMPKAPETLDDFADYEQRLSAWNYRRLLAQKYDVVCTNPPYMGASGMNGKLVEFIKKNFADYKSDYFSAFFVRCIQMAMPIGKLGFFSPYVWMFIQSYEKWRNLLCQHKTIETLIQFEYSAFEEATVPVCTFVFSNSHVNKRGCYLRLTDFRGGMEVQRQKTLEAIDNHNCGYYFEQSSDNFSKIPGAPVAYWASQRALRAYQNPNMNNVAQPRHGLATSDNDRFLKLWHEIDINQGSLQKRCQKDRKWFPMSKGGSFRKWYGNLKWVINYENDGKEIKDFAISIYKCSSRTIQNTQFYFQEGLTWSALTSGGFSVRWQEKGALFGSGGYCAFMDDSLKFYVLALLNSKVTGAFVQFVSPTLNYEVGHIKTIPVVVSERNQTVTYYALNNISLSRTDWDSFETSWDFKKHPLV